MRPHEVPYLLGDPSKAKERLGWETEVDFKELCNMMYNADLEYVSATELKEERDE